jgi:hypothetical protein
MHKSLGISSQEPRYSTIFLRRESGYLRGAVNPFLLGY